MICVISAEATLKASKEVCLKLFSLKRKYISFEIEIIFDYFFVLWPGIFS